MDKFIQKCFNKVLAHPPLLRHYLFKDIMKEKF